MGWREWFGIGEATASQTGILSPFTDASHLARITWAELLSLTEHDAPVTRAQAMSIPAVARARHVIAGQAGRVLLVAAGREAGNAAAFYIQPERWRARSLTFTWIADHQLFYGRAWLYVTDRYQSDKRPAHVELISPDRLTDQPDGPHLDGRKINAADLLRVDGPHEGLLNYAQPQLKAARALYASSSRAVDNPVPSVELHQTQGDVLNKAEREALVAAWAAARRGVNGGVAYTNQAIEVRTHGVAAEQLLVGVRGKIAIEMAQLTNVPGWAIDAEIHGSSITYSNSPSRMRELLDVTLSPYFDATAGRFSMDDIAPRGTSARFATEMLTSPDFTERMNGYRAAQSAGIYSAEECQALERSQYPGLDLVPAPAPAIERTPA